MTKAFSTGILIFATALLPGACGKIAGNSIVPAPQGYVVNRHDQTMLKRPLREISGIDYLSADELVAINDEVGKLFFLNPSTGKYKEAEFGKKGDYEDVVKVNGSFFVLASKGDLFEVDAGTLKLIATYPGRFNKFMEFESLCFDRPNNQLLLICKECGKNEERVAAWRFDLSTHEFVRDTYFEIPWKDIRRLAKNNAIECKPSAAAINPVNGKLYIIASLGKVLLQCTPDGKLEAVYGLNPDHFPQPEGLTFSPAGDMYISNEGIQGKATLLRFVFDPKKITGY